MRQYRLKIPINNTNQDDKYVDNTEKLLEALTNAHGVSGYESEIRGVLREYLEPLGKRIPGQTRQRHLPPVRQQSG
jgi:hypothetical protein